MAITQEEIVKALRQIKNPLKTGAPDQDIVSAGLLESIAINGDIVSICLQIDPADAERVEPVRAACEKIVEALAGVSKVRAIMTAKKAPSPAKGNGKAPPPPTPKKIKGVKYFIAVASGKGGVGKSTTSVNLAYALKQKGLKVAIADCDVYGPSAAMLLGLNAKPEFTDDDRIKPVMKDGLKAISMSFLVPPETAAVWRGPMVIGAIQQFLTGVAWDMDGDVDVLIADLPPGTGDVQLTMCQTAIVDGAVIVSTPQDLALIDARKAVDMFTKTRIPILGVVENMSQFVCPKCHQVSNLFGHGGAEQFAHQYGMDFLGAVPLHMDIRACADAGTPIVEAKPDSPEAQSYHHIADGVMRHLAVEL